MCGCELKNTFLRLIETARQRYPDKSSPGFGGGWTAEERRGDDLLMFEMFDGGFNQYIKSRKYGLMLHRSYTVKDGDVVEFSLGTQAELDKLIDDLAGYPHADSR